MIPPSVSDALVARAATLSQALVAIFHRRTHEVLYLNDNARRTLDLPSEAKAALPSLADLFGVEWLERLDGEILLRASLMGQWTGRCMLRSVWGTEIPVLATIILRSPASATESEWGCLHALPCLGTGASTAAGTSDHELLHALLETVTDTVYFKDRHSRFIRVSRSLALKDGIRDPALLIGKTDFDRFTPEHAQPAYDDEQRIIASGAPVLDQEEKETWPDGRVTWVSTSKFPLCDQAGRVIGTFGISRDITARKLTEQKNRELETQLHMSHRLESIGRLAAGVAHEINTPTQYIADNTRFLTTAFPQLLTMLGDYRRLRGAASALPDLAEQAAAVASAEKLNDLDYLLEEIPRTLVQTTDGLNRITRIVKSLKEFSHPSSPEPSPIDLNRTIETAITVSRHEWKYVAAVQTLLDSALPPVPCVADEFNQVMLNLIVNAAHAIETAQRQSGDRSASGRITVRTSRDGGHALIEITDTGTGIPEEVRHHIFEPFFTTKEVGRGTGQGLAFVHTVIVKHHGGMVDFVTESGHGTTFRLRLPLETPHPKQKTLS